MITQTRWGSGYNSFRGNTSQNSVSFSVIDKSTGSNTGTTTNKDAILQTQSGTKNNFQLVLSGLAGTDAKEFNSLTPTTCTIDSTGNATWQSNGLASIDIVTAKGRLGYSQIMINAGAQSVFQSWVTLTAAKHIDTTLSGYVSGKTAGSTTQTVFSSVTVAGTTGTNVTRNSNLFTGSLDLTAISVSTDNSGTNQYPVILISPSIIMTGHIGIPVNGVVVFKNNSGVYESRTVTSVRALSSNNGQTQANFVGLLSAPITTITPMAFLPSTYATQLPCFANGYPLPLLNKGYTAGDFIRVLTTNIVKQTSGVSWLYVRQATDAVYSTWSTPVISGDSNGPIFVPINGVPALLGCMNTTYGAVMLPDVLSDIQTQMTALLSGQTLSTVSLTGFITP
jgi:hypothetical protein